MLALPAAQFSLVCFHIYQGQGLLLQSLQLDFNSRKHRHSTGTGLEMSFAQWSNPWDIAELFELYCAAKAEGVHPAFFLFFDAVSPHTNQNKHLALLNLSWQ